MNKYEFKAKTYLATEDNAKVKEIAAKHGIQLPSDDLAIFVTKYAALEDANLNGVRLATAAVEKFLGTINGKLADIDHIRPYVIGSILDGWINADTKEIEIAFTMYKSVFIEEYAQALEKLHEGSLSVSFELTTNPDTIEHMADDTIRLHDIVFSGVGLLLNTNPAYPKAKVYEMANRLLNKVKDSNMVFASQIAEELGSNVIAEIEKVEEIDAAKWTTKYINSLPNSSFAVIEPAYLDGKTDNKNARHLPFKDENGKVDLPHLRNALARVNQVKPVTDSISAEELQKKASAVLEKYRHLLENSQEGGQSEMAKPEELKKEEVSEATTEVKTVADTTVETNHECKQVQTIKDSGDVTVETTDKTTQTVTEGDGTSSTRTEENTSVVTYTQSQVDEMLQPYASKANDLEEENQLLKARIKELEDANTAREQAEIKAKADAELQEKVNKVKAELGDNPYTKEFKDEDFLDEAKVEKAKILKERDDARAEVEALKKSKETETVEAAAETVTLVTGHEEVVAEKDENQGVGKLINKLGKE